MKTYPDGYVVHVDVDFGSLNDVPVIPLEITATLHDGDDQILADFGSLPFSEGDTQKTVVIASEFNCLQDGELIAARVLRVAIKTAEGVINRTLSYSIEGEFRLVVMGNSFLTYENAELLTRNMVNLSGWAAADENRRYAALIEAFNRLTAIPMRFAQVDDQNRIIESEETIILRHEWQAVTVQDFLKFPDDFKRALRAAQVTEANELLQGDGLGRKHRAGIATETIGESSITLRAGAVDYGLSSQTLATLRGYIYFSMRIQRT